MKNEINMYGIIILVLLVAGCTSNNSDDNLINESVNDLFSYEQGKIKVYFFWGDGCPHCNTQKQFFESIESKYPEMEILMFETYRNQSNVRLFQEISAKYGATPRGVPATFIGDKMWIGFTSNIGREMEQKIEYCLANECKIPE